MSDAVSSVLAGVPINPLGKDAGVSAAVRGGPSGWETVPLQPDAFNYNPRHWTNRGLERMLGSTRCGMGVLGETLRQGVSALAPLVLAAGYFLYCKGPPWASGMVQHPCPLPTR